ncbi:MAG: hypothetical protein ACFWT2_12115 [Thermoanaerobacterium thermosaccharolyticum]|jgi:hypothetical protein
MVKKILAVILTFSLVFSMTSLSFADDSTHTAIFVVGQSSYMQDNLSKSMDAATFIQNGRTYVPLRYLGLALGVDENDIQWDSASQTATLSMNGTTLKFTIGKTTYYANNQANSMDVAPIVKNGRVYLPARYVAEAFEYDVNWNSNSQEITVSPSPTLVAQEQAKKQQEELNEMARHGEVINVEPDEITIKVLQGGGDIGNTITAKINQFTSVQIGMNFVNKAGETTNLTKYFQKGDLVDMLYKDGQALALHRNLRPNETDNSQVNN